MEDLLACGIALCVKKRDLVEIRYFRGRINQNFIRCPRTFAAVYDSPDFRKLRHRSASPGCFIGIYQIGEGNLPFSGHNAPEGRIIPKDLCRVIADLRAAEPELRARKNPAKIAEQRCHILHIPHIAGKSDHVRPSPVQVREDPVRLLIDRILRQLDNRVTIIERIVRQFYHRVTLTAALSLRIFPVNLSICFQITDRET